MKKIIITMLSCASIFFLANWSSDETTVEGERKQSVNFYGTLVTQQGKQYDVDNIAVGRKTKKIVLYDAVPNNQKSHKNKKSVNVTDEKKIIHAPSNKTTLTSDPKEGIIVKIDLNEISEIRVPNPAAIFSYQKRKGSRKIEYLEIIVISNNETKTKNHYLLDLNQKLTCDQINDAGPIELEMPFKAIEKLSIKGYNHRDEKKDKAPNKNKKKTNQKTIRINDKD